MNKLIELLREFPSNDAKVLDKEDSAIIDTWQEFVYWNRIYLYETIISKKFGFIKRLVDNDKIDRDKCWFKNEWFRNWYDKWIVLAENYDNDTYKVTEFYRPYFQLLMLLSIQDESIEFLISILK
jgi:hypothetical protein